MGTTRLASCPSCLSREPATGRTTRWLRPPSRCRCRAPVAGRAAGRSARPILACLRPRLVAPTCPSLSCWQCLCWKMLGSTRRFGLTLVTARGRRSCGLPSRLPASRSCRPCRRTERCLHASSSSTFSSCRSHCSRTTFGTAFCLPCPLRTTRSCCASCAPSRESYPSPTLIWSSFCCASLTDCRRVQTTRTMHGNASCTRSPRRSCGRRDPPTCPRKLRG
mmetsp:Transcript_2467/g.7868  ORF Transcript_2467/g.7868 Transcript_2467/m.7868 type:complete len:221 (-) Transcript_2467:691-1353(-)